MRKMYQSEVETVLDWLLYRITPELRRELMGDLPRHYAMLFPDVDPSVITAAVTERIAQVAGQHYPLPDSATLIKIKSAS